MKKKDRDELAIKVRELTEMLEKVTRPHRRMRELEETVNELAGQMTRLIDVLLDQKGIGPALEVKGFSPSIPL